MYRNDLQQSIINEELYDEASVDGFIKGLAEILGREELEEE